MLRRRAAAAADQARSRTDQRGGRGCKRLRTEVEPGLAVHQVRHAGIRLGCKRNLRVRLDGADNPGHRLRPGRAIAAERIRTEPLQRHQRGDGVDSGQCASARLEGQRHEGGQLGELADRDERRARLLQIHHGFDRKPVDAAAFEQRADLALVNLHCFVERQLPIRLNQLPGRRDIGENELVRNRPAREPGEFAVDLLRPVRKAELREFKRVAAERRSIDDIASGGGITALHVDDRIGIVENPRFGADAGRHAAFGQLGPGRAVEAQNALDGEGFEFTACHAYPYGKNPVSIY